MRLDNGTQYLFMGTLAGIICVSATRWNSVLTVSVPVLRSTPGGPHLPPAPLPLSRGDRKGERSVAEAKECWCPLTQWSHEYGTCPMEKSGFFDHALRISTYSAKSFPVTVERRVRHSSMPSTYIRPLCATSASRWAVRICTRKNDI